MDELMDGWMDGGMDGWITGICQVVYIICSLQEKLNFNSEQCICSGHIIVVYVMM